MPTAKAPFMLTHDTTGEVRLVRATSRTAALLHVATPPWWVAIATIDDLIKHWLNGGVKVETAGESADPDPAGKAPGASA